MEKRTTAWLGPFRCIGSKSSLNSRYEGKRIFERFWLSKLEKDDLREVLRMKLEDAGGVRVINST